MSALTCWLALLDTLPPVGDARSQVARAQNVYIIIQDESGSICVAWKPGEKQKEIEADAFCLDLLWNGRYK